VGVGRLRPKWTEEDSRGNPIHCEHNTRALFDHYGITCRYNEMTKQTEVNGDRTLRVNITANADVNILHATTAVRDTKGRVGVWVYVPDVTKMSACVLKVSLTDATFGEGAFQTYSFSDGDKNFNGWHFIGYTAAQFGGSYGTPDFVNHDVATIRLSFSALAATSVYVDDYRIGWSQVARLVISDDDGYASWFNHGLPVLESFGLKASMGIIGSLVGLNSSWVTEAQLADAYSKGHDLVTHGNSAMSSLPSNAARLADIKSNRDFLQTRGFTRALGMYIWPNGVYQLSAGDQTLIDMLKSEGFVCARGTTTLKTHKTAVGKSDGRWLLPVIGADSSYTVTQLKSPP
jgi:hypothetical protein